MKKFILFLSVFIISNYTLIPISTAVSSVYVWSTSNSAVTTNTTIDTDLQLESGGAILIEQTTRASFI